MTLTPLHDWIGNKIGHSATGFSREHVEQYQLEKLQEVLNYALAHSPFYKSHFKNSRKTIRSLADISLLPFTSAVDLQQHPNQFVCVPQNDIQRIVTLPTSGTSGTSKRIFFTREDLELTIDFFMVGMSTLAKAANKVIIFLPGQRPDSVGDLLKKGLEKLGCSAMVYGPVDDEEKILELILEMNVNILVGAPVHLYRLARIQEKEKILPENQIQKVLTSTDTLAPVLRDNIESSLHCEVFDHYGMTETGLGGGVECESHHGFHLREADLFYEIVDPRDGHALPDGEPGEVVVTTLTRAGMPLIRYRTGDEGLMIPETCACGSFIRRLGNRIVRISDGIQLDWGIITQLDLDGAIFRNKEVVDYSVFFEKNNGRQKLRFEIRSLNAELNILEQELIKSLKHIPALGNEMENGRIVLEFAAMKKRSQETPNALVKRKIITENPVDGLTI